MEQSASHSISRLYSIQYFFYEQRKNYLRKQSRTQTHKPSTNKTNKIRCTTKKKTNAQIYSTKLHPECLLFCHIHQDFFFGQEKKRFYIFALAPRRTLSGVTPMDLFFCMIMTRVKFPPCFSANRRELVFRKLDCPSIDKDYF